MPITIDYQIVTHSNDVPDQALLDNAVKETLYNFKSTAEVVIRVVDDEESANLNETYRNRQGSTNVLSFPFEAPPEVPIDLLGDIVICMPVVIQQANQQNKSIESHFIHMMVHGVLHLLGFDHLSDEEANEMEKLETDTLYRLNYPDPYHIKEVT